MTLSTSLETYADCEEYFNQALASAKGIAIDCGSPGQANRMRQRLNTYRKRIREMNLLVYPEGHTLHGKSPWDHMICRTSKDNPNEVQIDKEALIPAVKVREL